MVHCAQCGVVPVPAGELPVELPEPDDIDLQPKGESPLASHPTWAKTACPKCSGEARRDTDTMDTFVDSSWYFLRYCSPGREDVPFASEDVERWMPVDQYTGGIEHAILHLLYARFVTKALHDLGYVGFVEPFKRLKSQGMVIMQGAKMSKSKGNLVEPTDIVAEYGADTLRIAVLFAGPIEEDVDWADVSEAGVFRWLGRLCRLVDEHAASGGADAEAAGDTEAVERAAHRAIAGVTDDFEQFKYNTAIAKLMELSNEVGAAQRAGARGPAVQHALEAAAVMLSPIAPFVAEELWQRLGREPSVAFAQWPIFDPAKLATDTITVPVQVDGKVRGEVEVAAEAGEDEVVAAARAVDNVARHLEGRQVEKTVWVPGRLLNLVTAGEA
jgi:leucyl-tRNA synthetase